MDSARRSTDGVDVEHPSEFVRAVIKESRDVIVVSHDDGMICFVSGALEATTGWAPADLLGTDGFHLLHPDDLASFGEHVTRLLEHPSEPSTTEVRIRCRDGEWVWAEVVAVNLLDDPAVRGLVGHFRDITARKDYEARLRESEERFRSLVHNGFDLVAITDKAGDLTYVSPSCEPFLGNAHDAFVHQGTVPDQGQMAALVHPLDADGVRHAIRAIRRRVGASERVRCRFRDTFGRWRWFECVFTNQVGVPGVDGFVSNCREITDTVVAMEQLAEWEARFGALVRHSSDLILVVDAAGEPTYVSPALDHVLGYSVHELFGREPSTLVPPVEIDAWIQCYETALAKAGAEHTAIVRGRHADGRGLELEVRTTSLLDEPSVRGVVFHIRDVTEQRVVRKELERRALHDALTDLPNRALLWDRLKHALDASARRPTAPAVLFVDLDGFKAVNDTIGHDAGDRLLVEVATRLEDARRGADTVARMGGDEFVVVLEDLADEREAIAVAERIVRRLQGPYESVGAEHVVTASVGLAFADQAGVHTPESIVRAADAAMYRAKKRGGNCLAVAGSS